MYNWQDKKLLVLGATKFQSEIVKQAQKYGAYVYVIDYNENSPAKKIADESFLINAVDVDLAVKLIKEENINGVLTGFADSLLPAYKEICEKAQLPCYITSNEQLKFATEKQVFKNYLKEFEIPFVDDLKEIDKKDFPIIVKPVDNSGARGICICNNEEELQQGISTALNFSKSKKYLLEKYLNYKEATAFYLFIDGKPYFTLMGDRHVANVKDGFIKLPTGYTFPSPYSKKFYEETHPKFVKLFDKLQIKNGMMFIQCFIDENGNCIPYESGFRLTGSLEYILLEKVSGYNPLAMMINYALTGKMCADNEISKINPFIKQKCFNISCLIEPGTIKKISGIEELKKQPGIVDIYSSYDENDTIPDDIWGKLAQIALRIFIVPNNEHHYIFLQKVIEILINITSTQNQNMLINKKIEEEMDKSTYKNILITGAGGVLAQNLINKFLKDGSYNITSSTRDVNTLLNKQNGINYVNNNDLFSKDTLKNIDIIINCAFPRSQDTITLYEGMQFFEKLILKSIDLNVKGIINISSQSVYGEYREIPSREIDNLKPGNNYALVKAACEEIGWALTQRSSVKYTNIRLASLIGKEYSQRSINKIINKANETGKIEIQNDKDILGYMDLDDAADGLYAFVKNSDINKWEFAYNLGVTAENEITMEKYAQIIKKHFNNMYREIEININTKDKADKLCLMISDNFYKASKWKPSVSVEKAIKKYFIV